MPFVLLGTAGEIAIHSLDDLILTSHIQQLRRMKRGLKQYIQRIKTSEGQWVREFNSKIAILVFHEIQSFGISENGEIANSDFRGAALDWPHGD